MFGYTLAMIFFSRLLSTHCDNSTTEAALTELNHELQREFNDMDNDNNHLVNLPEFDIFVNKWDTDKDGCVAVAEYASAHPGNSHAFNWAMFNHFDHNQDSCLEIQDMIDEFHEIDVDPKNGTVTIFELDTYYDRIFTKLGLIRHN